MRNFNVYRWAILIIICVLYFFVCLHRLSPSVIARDLSLSLQADAVMLGIIASSYFYLYSAMQPVVGYLADTTGPRKVMSIFFLLSAIGSLIFGLAPNAIVAVLGRTLIGAGLAGIFVSALKIFSRWYRKDQFASLTGVMITIGGLGGLAAAMPLTYLVLLLGWRGSFVAIGLISVALSVLAWIILRDSPKDKGWPSLADEDNAAAQTGKGMTVGKRLAILFGNRDFCMICLAVFLIYGAALTFQGLWAIPYLMDVFGMDKVKAGWTLMAWPLGWAVGGPAAGLLTDKLNLNRKNALLFALGLATLLWLVLIFLQGQGQMIIVVPLLFLFGLTGGGALPLSFTITRDLFPFELMGTATGLMNTASFLGSAIYMPLSGLLLKSAASGQAGSYSFAAYRLLLISFLLFYAIAFIATALLSNRKNPGAPGV